MTPGKESDTKIFRALLAVLLCSLMQADAQRVGFRISSGSFITLTPVTPDHLIFDFLVAGSNVARSIPLHGANDDRVVVIAVDAPTGSDLSVRVDHASSLFLGSSTIPFELRFAYANKGNTLMYLPGTARADAVELPAGQNVATFTVSTIVSGPMEQVPGQEHLQMPDPSIPASTPGLRQVPGQSNPVPLPLYPQDQSPMSQAPPPVRRQSPDQYGVLSPSEGPLRSLPMARAYLFFYGTAGPASKGTDVVAGTYETTININVTLSTP